MAFQPQLKCLIFFLRHRAESVLHAREGVDLQKVFYANPTLIMKKKDYSYVGLTLQVEVRVPVLFLYQGSVSRKLWVVF